jgi:hypothetical protein
MSDTSTNPLTGGPPPPESQKERWLKYGANVLLSSIVVIVLAVLVTYLAQAHAGRIDTTLGGSQSLRPQTLDFIKENKKQVTIVALYPKLKSESREQDYYRPVADLLNDYASKGKNISVELFDPNTDKDRLNKLIADVTNKYGGEVKEYKALVTDLANQNTALKKYAVDEEAKLSALPQTQDEGLQQNILGARATLQRIAALVDGLQKAIDGDLEQPIPSYKDAADGAQVVYTQAQAFMNLISTRVLEGFKQDPTVPQAYKDYAPDAEAREADAAKIVNDVLDRIGKLPPLKELDEFRQQLTSKSIIVMAEGGYKILQFSDLWKIPEHSRVLGSSDAAPRLSFGGEQQVTSAIAQLDNPTKQMVVFVRSGGPPWTMSTGMQEPQLASIADRLREYNFDVQEKDAGGQPSNPEMTGPEPTDEQMKAAIWIVIRSPQDQQMGPSPLGSMLDKHLKDGGSAMVMLMPSGDAMADVLSQWGITAKTDFIVMHEPQQSGGRRSTDSLDSILQTVQHVFLLNEYGNHPITAPLNGLGFLTFYNCPVSVSSTPPPFVKVTPLLPVPLLPHAWGESDLQKLMNGRGGERFIFNPKADPEGGHPVADMDNTAASRLYFGAAAEKTGGGRLVVVGSFLFATNQIVNIRDDRSDVERLPGNSEFMADSILWLGHEDQMLAISPHALETARIMEISPVQRAIWSIGVLTIGLPLLVVLAGLMVYVRRRD